MHFRSFTSVASNERFVLALCYILLPLVVWMAIAFSIRVLMFLKVYLAGSSFCSSGCEDLKGKGDGTKLGNVLQLFQ
jgi:hypothetical protein